MVAITATDISGVEYFFTNTTIVDGSHDSDWQDSRAYEDTGLLPGTMYTYTVMARDKSVNYIENETAASDEASAITDAYENIVLPANGGVLESFTSEYDASYPASALTNGNTSEVGWCSVKDGDPEPEQEFVFSFKDGKSATLTNAIIYGGDAESGAYHSKDVEVHVSADGSTFTLAGSGTLTSGNSWIVDVDLTGVGFAVKKIKLVITSGYDSSYWELAEFVVNGGVID
jgi:hypothetical protein